MIIFLDTEFTDLVIDPQLLSVGMVTATVPGGEFYAEVTDRRRIHASSWFALDAAVREDRARLLFVCNARCATVRLR